MMTRFGNQGTQAALLAGFVIGSVTLIDQVGHSTTILCSIFYFLSYISQYALIHVVIHTLALSTWAPGLALRGRLGSLERAIDVCNDQRKIVDLIFYSGLGVFALQSILVTWIVAYDDETVGNESDAAIATLVILVGAFLSCRALIKLVRRSLARACACLVRMRAACTPS